MNNDEKIIVKQPKVSAFTSLFFQDLKKGFFLPLNQDLLQSGRVYTYNNAFAENINN